MDLRPELTPPTLDESLVAHLAKLASTIDGSTAGRWEDELTEFNRLAGTTIPFEEFQGFYGGEDHADYVRRVLYRQRLAPDPTLSREEMAEIVARVIAGGDHRDFYLELFTVNCRHPAGSDLIYWPDQVPSLPQDHEPTAEEIAELALRTTA